MTVIIIQADDFDDTTLPAADAQLTETKPGVWLYSRAGGVKFPAIGFIPWTSFMPIIGGKFARVLYAAVPTASVTDATLALTVGAARIASRNWNPAQLESIQGFPVPGEGYDFRILTNGLLDRTLVLEIVPLSSEEMATLPDTPEGAFGTVTASPRDVPSRVVGPYTAPQTIFPGDFVLYDTSGGAFTLPLPPLPEVGDVVFFKEDVDSAANALTVDAGGNVLELVAGGTAATTTYQIASGWICWRFVGGGVWKLEDERP